MAGRKRKLKSERKNVVSVRRLPNSNMIGRLRALKSDLQNRCLVLDEQEMNVCAQLMSVFPHYITDSVSAVVAMHSRDFVENSDGLMSTCVNFFLDENNTSVMEFLVDESFSNMPKTSTADDESSREDMEPKPVQNRLHHKEFWEHGDTSQTCRNNSSLRFQSPSLLCPVNTSGHVEDSSLNIPFFAAESASWSNEDESSQDQDRVISAPSPCDVSHHLEEDLTTDSSADLPLPSVIKNSVASMRETKAEPEAPDTASSSSSASSSVTFQTKGQKPADLKYRWRTASPLSPNENDVEIVPDHDDDSSTFSEGADLFSNRQLKFVNSNRTEPEIITPALNKAKTNSSERETESENSSSQSHVIFSLDEGSPHFSDTEESTALGTSMQVRSDTQSRQLQACFSDQASNKKYRAEAPEQYFASTSAGLHRTANRIPANTFTDSSESDDENAAKSDDDSSNSEQLLPTIVASRCRSNSQNLLSPAKTFSASVVPGSNAVVTSLFQAHKPHVAGTCGSKTEGITYLGKGSSLAYSPTASNMFESDAQSYVSAKVVSGQVRSNTLCNKSNSEDSKLRSLVAISASQETGDRVGRGSSFMSRSSATATQMSGLSGSRPDAVERLDNLSPGLLRSASCTQALENSSPTISGSACKLQKSVTSASSTTTSTSTSTGLVSFLRWPPGPAETQTYPTPVPGVAPGASFPGKVTARGQTDPSPLCHEGSRLMNSSAEKSYHWSSPLISSILGQSTGVNITSVYSTHVPVANPQGPTLLVYPHVSTCVQAPKPHLTCLQSGQSTWDLAGRSTVNSAHPSNLLSPGSGGLTSAQSSVFTVTATTSGVKGKINDGASTSMAGASTSTSMGGTGGTWPAVNTNSCASKRKGQFEEKDIWNYRDSSRSPDVVVVTDDRFNDSLGSVQLVANNPGTMNNPIILRGALSPLVHPGLEFGVQSILDVFPDVEVAYVRDMLNRFLSEGNILDYAVHNILNQLLETPDFPRQIFYEETQHKAPKKDFFNDYSYPEITPTSSQVSQTLDILSSEFRLIGRNEIKQVLCRCNYHYAPAYKCLSEAMATFVESSSGSPPSSSPREITVICHEGKENEWKAKFRLLKKSRTRTRQTKDCIQDHCPDLREEIEFIKEYQRQQNEESDHQMAWKLLEKDYEEEGQTIECGCCFTQFPFEKLVQCFDGHLFCCDCLQGYAREAVFGSGKLNLTCMTEGCETPFPKSQLIKALSDDVMQKYDERLAEESLNMAAISDLVRCPYCSLAAVLDASQKIFKCPGPRCQKETCRDCREDWENHRGKTCEEVEKKDETKLRKKYEEKMTSLRVRMCPSCKAQFFKEEGCNKMTCRCGTTMCYLCREPLITYKHFCQHPRDPGKSCTECNACSLWTNPDEDEKRAVAEMQKEAQLKRREQGFQGDRIIGAPDGPPAKKQKS